MDARLRWVFLAVLAAARPAPAFDHSHPEWNALLKRHVVLLDGAKASRLQYSAMAQERGALQQYLESLSRVSEAEFKAWSGPEQMAFLINAYNAHTVEKVLTRYPNLKSIWDFGRFFSNPFRDPFFSLLGGKTSLDTVEHEILRKKYPDPRIHYAVNCASVGSKIFDWFKEDFEPPERYFARYARLLSDDPGQQKLVADGKARLSFLDYDWSLNDSRSSSPR